MTAQVDQSGATLALSRFITAAAAPTLSKEAREGVKAAILGVLGTGLAGAQTSAAARVREFVLSMDSTPVAQLWGRPERAGLPLAALANGVAAHLMDWDDLSESAQAHLSVAIVPAALALAEHLELAGRALVDAYVVGFEVAACLGRAMNPFLVENGWHATGVLGSIAATAAACRVIGNDANTTGMALGIAVSSASSLLINTSTETQALHAGFAARAGVEAALLAKAGVGASQEAISGRFGLAGVYAEIGEERLATELARLGTVRDLEITGINLKAYPCCASAHRPVEAVLDLAGTYGVTWDNVDRIWCRISQLAHRKLHHSEPTSPLQAKVHLPYCIAAALEDRGLEEGSFSEERIHSTSFQDRMRRVQVTVHPDQRERRPPDAEFADVTLFLRDGQELTALVQRPQGAHDRPLGVARVRAKFRAGAQATLGGAQADACIAAVEALDELDNVRDVVRLLRPQPTAQTRGSGFRESSRRL